MLGKFFRFFKPITKKDIGRNRKNRHKVLDEWSSDMRRSHPCPLCRKKCTWLGKLCDKCQEKLEIFCPCDADDASYWDANRKKEYIPPKRAPLPDLICSELCNRCGMRIKSIWELMEQTDGTENDEKIENLIEHYEKLALKDGGEFREGYYKPS